MKKVRKGKEPSKASLRDIPEIDFRTARVRRNPYLARVAEGGIIHVRRGRRWLGPPPG
jgi:hypothetical protein